VSIPAIFWVPSDQSCACYDRLMEHPPTLSDQASLLAASIIEAAVDWRRGVVAAEPDIRDRLRAAGAAQPAELDELVTKAVWPGLVNELLRAINRALHDAHAETLLQPLDE